MTPDTSNRLLPTRWPVSHLCLVGPLPPPSGGMAEQTLQLAQLLSDEGITVKIVQVNCPHSNKWYGQIKGVRALLRLIPYIFHLWRSIGESSLVHVMANSGWSWHLYAAPAIWISHIRKTPVLVNYRGGGAADFLKSSEWLVKQTLQKANALILPSGFLVKVFGTHGISGKIVPNIVDLAKFFSIREHSMGAKPHIVVTRNLEKIYGIDIALLAFKRILEEIPGALLTIAGTGDQADELLQFAQELNLDSRVSFVGRLDREQIINLYKTADLLLNSSRVDNMPNSLLEALASGVPIVSTNAGGIPYMVENQRTAILVEIDDHVSMANASIMLLRNLSLRQEIVSNGLKEANKYSWESVSLCLKTAYAEALAMNIGLRK